MASHSNSSQYAHEHGDSDQRPAELSNVYRLLHSCHQLIGNIGEGISASSHRENCFDDFDESSSAYDCYYRPYRSEDPQCHDRNESGEVTSAHSSADSDNHHVGDNGDDVLGRAGRSRRQRPRRSAYDRRQQQMRSDARMITRLLKGLSSIDTHRGNRLSSIGNTLRNSLQQHSAPASFGGPVQTEQMPHRYYTNECRPICRHYLAKRCTYGAYCRFSHDADCCDTGENIGMNMYADGSDSADIVADSLRQAARNAAHNSLILLDTMVADDCELNTAYEESKDQNDTSANVNMYYDDRPEVAAPHDGKVGDSPVDFEIDDSDTADIVDILKALPAGDVGPAFGLLPSHLQDEVCQFLQRIDESLLASLGHRSRQEMNNVCRDAQPCDATSLERLAECDTQPALQLRACQGLPNKTCIGLHCDTNDADRTSGRDTMNSITAASRLRPHLAGSYAVIPASTANTVSLVLEMRNLNKKILRKSIGARVLAQAIEQRRKRQDGQT